VAGCCECGDEPGATELVNKFYVTNGYFFPIIV
jgi:hypothetical protein